MFCLLLRTYLVMAGGGAIPNVTWRDSLRVLDLFSRFGFGSDFLPVLPVLPRPLSLQVFLAGFLCPTALVGVDCCVSCGFGTRMLLIKPYVVSSRSTSFTPHNEYIS